jgi:hypothetical protein
MTRRLYRSGESAYFLNKQPCRLKDIHNIFLGSGLGARSYAFIQQGNIGIITEAGPEERRYFVEEAAGVTRYKHHKTEALRKIELPTRTCCGWPTSSSKQAPDEQPEAAGPQGRALQQIPDRAKDSMSAWGCTTRGAHPPD